MAIFFFRATYGVVLGGGGGCNIQGVQENLVRLGDLKYILMLLMDLKNYKILTL